MISKPFCWHQRRLSGNILKSAPYSIVNISYEAISAFIPEFSC